MRVIIQRVKESSCKVDDKITGQIEQGYMLLVGITFDDTKEIVEKVANKIVDLRIFEDENGKMNKSLKDVDGDILSISQFTLYASIKKGRRPSFTDAAKAEQASSLYDYFNEYLRNKEIKVETGIFGADMKVSLINDGPVTIIVDSEEL